MSHKLSIISGAVLSVLFAGYAVADDASISNPTASGAFVPATVHEGVFEIQPWIALVAGINSNAGSSNTNKTSSVVTSINPNVVIGLPTQGQLYAVKYAGNYTQFASSTIDNFNDHNFSAFADNAWTMRLKSLLSVNYNLGHDARNAVLNGSQEQWHTGGVSAMGHYGTDDSTGQFELSGSENIKRYDSNNSHYTQYYDYSMANVKGTFFYRVAPATHMFVEAGESKYSYDVAEPALTGGTLDSTEQRYMVGVKWIATAKTTGSIKVGEVVKNFDSSLRAKGTGTVWDADVIWSPKQYSKFDASLHQTVSEDGSVAGYVVTQDSNLTWSQDWSGFISSAVTLGNGEDKFQGGARTDKRESYSLKGIYNFRSWLRAGLEFKDTKRDSTTALWSYTQAVTMLTLEGSL